MIAAAAQATERLGTGGGASPLVTGHGESLARLERKLAEFEGTEAALVFSSGYAANVGTIAALVGRGDAIYADQKNHASMIDGCRLSRAEVQVYPHNDCDALETLLADGPSYRRRLIATESLFSMDGDLAPLARLVELAEAHDCMLLVDEAHATGVFGPNGRGVAESLGIDERIAVRIGTLSKALGAAGGFVCGTARLVDWLVNRARAYVFSTALPPATCAAGVAALDIVRLEPERRQALLARAAALRAELRRQGWQLGASESQIIPLILGDPESALQVAAELRQAGILAPAIRPPSVPDGESLVRISLTAGHTEPMIERLRAALAAARRTVTTARVVTE
jgi:8-amino-7-oxononanoate synthase